MTQNNIGKTCPYCQFPIKQNLEVIVCSECNIPHHRECWEENRGCTTFGCTKPSNNASVHDRLDISLGDQVNQQTNATSGGLNVFIVSVLVISLLLFILLLDRSNGVTSENEALPQSDHEQTNQQSNPQASQQTDEINYYVITESGNNLFIRKSPGRDNKSDSDVITRVPRGTKFKLIDKHGDDVRKDGFTWWEIRVIDSGISGWVAAEYISTSKQSTPQFTQQTDEAVYYVITEPGSNLFIRKSPGIDNKSDSDIITRVPRGTRLNLTDKHDNSIRRDGFTWWEIRVIGSGISGWVAAEYISTNASEVYR